MSAEQFSREAFAHEVLADFAGQSDLSDKVTFATFAQVQTDPELADTLFDGGMLVLSDDDGHRTHITAEPVGGWRSILARLLHREVFRVTIRHPAAAPGEPWWQERKA